MPIITIYENGNAFFSENEVRSSRELLHIFTIA